MTHQQLADGFKLFTFQCINEENDLKSLIPILSDDILYRRIIFSRLYYALYHKFLQEDQEIRELSGPGQHAVMLEKLKRHDNDLYRVYAKLHSLRIWADYKIEEDQEALELTLKTLNQQVHKVLQRTSFNL